MPIIICGPEGAQVKIISGRERKKMNAAEFWRITERKFVDDGDFRHFSHYNFIM